jgi:hypothetical protein
MRRVHHPAAMNNDNEALSAVYKKIEREKALINAANAMRQQTTNESVKSKLDTQVREGRRNIQYLEEKMRELQMRKMGQNMDNMHLGPGGDGGPSGRPSSGLRNDRDGPPPPPPKDSRAQYLEQGTDRGDYGSGDYSTGFDQNSGDMMPPRHPYAQPAPGTSGYPKQRPNFSKLGSHSYSLTCSLCILIFN